MRTFPFLLFLLSNIMEPYLLPFPSFLTNILPTLRILSWCPGPATLQTTTWSSLPSSSQGSLTSEPAATTCSTTPSTRPCRDSRETEIKHKLDGRTHYILLCRSAPHQSSGRKALHLKSCWTLWTYSENRDLSVRFGLGGWVPGFLYINRTSKSYFSNLYYVLYSFELIILYFLLSFKSSLETLQCLFNLSKEHNSLENTDTSSLANRM